jgi:hypothetical protein
MDTIGSVPATRSPGQPSKSPIVLRNLRAPSGMPGATYTQLPETTFAAEPYTLRHAVR